MSTNNADSHGEVNNTEGQKPDKKLVFDSKDIGKREKTDYFVRVEGAEERKREVIRRMQQQKDELVREKKAKEAAEKKDQKLQRRLERKQKFADAVWTGRRKVLTITVIIIILILAIGGPFFWKEIISPLMAKQQRTSEFQDEVDSSNKGSEMAAEAMNKISESDNSNEAYEEAKKEFETTISSSSKDVEKIYLAINYAAVIFDYENDGERAGDELVKYESLIDGQPHEVVLDYYAAVCMYYNEGVNEEKKDHYNAIMNDLVPDDGFVVSEEDLRSMMQEGAKQ